MIENEIRILNINEEEFIAYLEKKGAVKTGSWIQKRKTYDFHPIKPGKWIRLRTNGSDTTLTIKEVIDKTKVDGVKEIEIEVSDFDKTDKILEELGYFARSFQENKRIRYIYKDVEFDIDTWPLIPTYVEIEGDSVCKIEEVLKEFSYKEEDLTTLDVRSIYKKFYNIDEDSYKILTFDEQIKR